MEFEVDPQPSEAERAAIAAALAPLLDEPADGQRARWRRVAALEAAEREDES